MADRHDGIETPEGLQSAAGARAYRSTKASKPRPAVAAPCRGEETPARRFRPARDWRDAVEFDQNVTDRLFKERHSIARHHGHARHRQFERRGPGFGERRASRQNAASFLRVTMTTRARTLPRLEPAALSRFPRGVRHRRVTTTSRLANPVVHQRRRLPEHALPFAEFRRCGCPVTTSSSGGWRADGALPRHSAAARPPVRSRDARHSSQGGPSSRSIRRGLERQQRQDEIDVGAHGARAPRPPGPDRGANIIDDRESRRQARTRRATRWVNSGLSIITSASGRRQRPRRPSADATRSSAGRSGSRQSR